MIGAAKRNAPDEEDSGANRHRCLLLVLLFLAPAASLLWQIPIGASFSSYCFADMGGAIKAVYFVQHAQRYGTDFRYPYGLLVLSVTWIWSDLFGPSVLAYLGMMFMLQIAVGAALVRFAVCYRLGFLAITLILFQSSATPWGAVYPLEELAVISALSELARGRNDLALAWATACVFAKPSMAYVLGFVVLIFLFVDSRKLPPSEILGRLCAAISVGAAMLVVFSAVYGPRSAMDSVLPTTGAAIYKYADIGFFGKTGKTFWAPQGKGFVKDYVLHEAGYYLLGSAGLFVTACAVVWQYIVAGSLAFWPAQRCVLAAAVCLLVYLAAFFGGWHYDYLITLGLASSFSLLPLLKVGRFDGFLKAAIILLAASANVVPFWHLFVSWRSMRFPGSQLVYRCAVFPIEEEEWKRCLDASALGARMVLAGSAIDVVDPSLRALPCVYPMRGAVTRAELDRAVALLNSSEYVIVPKSFYPVEDWPEFRTVSSDFSIAFDGKYFRLRRRKTGTPQ